MLSCTCMMFMCVYECLNLMCLFVAITRVTTLAVFESFSEELLQCPFATICHLLSTATKNVNDKLLTND